MGWYIISSIGQWASCVLLAAGIIIEIVYRADVGFLSVTIGSSLFAIVTKIKAGSKDAVIKGLVEKLDRKKSRR